MTVRIWFAATSFNSCTMPDGHSMRTTSALVTAEEPVRGDVITVNELITHLQIESNVEVPFS